MTNTKGSKYEATKELPLKECIKLVRADIKDFLASDVCPVKGAKLASCRMDGRAIQISLRVPTASYDFSGTMSQRWYALTYAPRNLYKSFDSETRMNALVRKVEAIAEEYNRDDSDIQSDYFSVRFYCFAGVIRDESHDFVCSIFEDLCTELGWNPKVSQGSYPKQVVEFLELHTGGVV